ncbi:hypothetical protein FHR92_003425 [Fontibacillus solani]|uniref:Uncharacterized protein n=1 Tax=Fontibacillus solani TaxID=1572857 RepID=A0A7W3XSV9_9BACL|nr:hypothetical protein [Fontibacillus solani]
MIKACIFAGISGIPHHDTITHEIRSWNVGSSGAGIVFLAPLFLVLTVNLLLGHPFYM